MKKKCFLILLYVCFINNGFTQFLTRKMSVRKTPVNSMYWLHGEEHLLATGYFSEKENWIVFSDRDENLTYAKAGSDIVFKSLAFMDACYVIGRKDNFVELIKYDPKLLKKPTKHKVEAKSAEYLGWVSMDNLLLWRGSLKDYYSLLPYKAVVAFKNDDVIQSYSTNTVKDSVLSFSSPVTNTQFSKQALRNLLYVYKQSGDEKRWLVGKVAHPTLDNYKKSMIGWVDANYLKLWGTRSCLAPLGNTWKNDDERFYTDTLKDASFFVQAGSSDYIKRIDGLYPVEKVIIHDSSKRFIKTSVFTDVFDYSKNFAINVLGRKISYDESRRNVRLQTNLNIVFVVDVGKTNGKYVGGLLNSFQSLNANLIESGDFRKIKYGAVVYKDNLSGCSSLANAFLLHEGVDELSDFFQRQLSETDKCNNDTVAQAMFAGVRQGARLLEDCKGESNIVIVIGAASNNMNENTSWRNVVSAINRVNARMLICQTHNISHPSFNDFIIQGKDLVVNAAGNNAELKKEKLIDSRQVLTENDFSLLAGDSGVYYLDYPVRSMEPGYVIFPAKNQLMPPFLLERSIDSLITNIKRDNQTISNAYRQYFRTVGISNTTIASSYKKVFPRYNDRYLPAKFLQSIPAEAPLFCVSGWILDSTNGADINGFEQCMLLAENEYAQVQNIFESLGKLFDPTHLERRYIYKKICRQLKGISIKRGLGKPEGYKRYSFAYAVNMMTGYTPADSLWQTKQLYMIKKKKKMTMDEILTILKTCRQKSLWMKNNISDKESSFISNGQIYHVLTKGQLF